jgi:hypothetical protein
VGRKIKEDQEIRNLNPPKEWIKKVLNNVMDRAVNRLGI